MKMASKILVSDPLSEEGLEILKASGFPVDVKPGLTEDELKKLIKELMQDKAPTTIIREDKPAKDGDHPTMKPIKLLARLIRNSSKPAETVLDPFGGSGSTLIACEQTNRVCRTMELDPVYCDVIVRRWEALTNQKAELVRNIEKE